jgi:hypothetical protein
MIRFDLARTRDFPEGSRERCYLLRVPLDDQQIVDRKALAAAPGRATVLRSWPDAPDMTGYLVHKRKGWAFSYAPGDADDEPLFHLEAHPLREGEYVTVTERDGTPLAFEISLCQALEDA